MPLRICWRHQCTRRSMCLLYLLIMSMGEVARFNAVDLFEGRVDSRRGVVEVPIDCRHGREDTTRVESPADAGAVREQAVEDVLDPVRASFDVCGLVERTKCRQAADSNLLAVAATAVIAGKRRRRSNRLSKRNAAAAWWRRDVVVPVPVLVTGEHR